MKNYDEKINYKYASTNKILNHHVYRFICGYYISM